MSGFLFGSGSSGSCFPDESTGNDNQMTVASSTFPVSNHPFEVPNRHKVTEYTMKKITSFLLPSLSTLLFILPNRSPAQTTDELQYDGPYVIRHVKPYPQPPTEKSDNKGLLAQGVDTVFRGTSSGIYRFFTAGNGLFRAEDNSNIVDKLSPPVAAGRGLVLSFVRQSMLAYNSLSYTGAARSTDNGTTWQMLTVPAPFTTPRWFVSRLGNIFLPGSFLYRSTNEGPSWTTLSTPFPPAECFYVSDVQTDSIIYAMPLISSSGPRSAYRTTNDGTAWQPLPLQAPDEGEVRRVYVRSGGVLFAILDSAGSKTVYRGSNRGDTWTLLPVPKADFLTFSTTTTSIFSRGTDSTLHRSTNDGDSWTQLPIPSMWVIPPWFSGSSVFAVGGSGNIFYRSLNNGDTWENIQAPFLLWRLLRLSYPIYVAADSGLYRYDQSGWTRFNFPESLQPGAYLWFSGSSPSLYVWGVIFRTEYSDHQSTTSLWNLNDVSASWANRGIPQQPRFFRTAFLQGSQFFYIGTFSSGLYRSPDNGQTWNQLVPPTTAVHDTRPALAYRLEQNFPNPFNPATTIRFSLPHAARVLVRVYNILGMQVATLLEDTRKTGDHEVTFQASELPSGVYFYQLQALQTSGGQAGDFVDTKKLLILR